MAVDHSSILVLGTVPSLMWQVTRCLRHAGHSCWPRIAATLTASQLQQLCKSKSIDNIMALDAGTALLLELHEHLPVPACAMPSPSLILTLQDKWNLTRCSAALGLPAPDTIRANDAAELLANSLVYPIVTKPLAPGGRPVGGLFRISPHAARCADFLSQHTGARLHRVLRDGLQRLPFYERGMTSFLRDKPLS